jgi:hypothetical protein
MSESIFFVVGAVVAILSALAGAVAHWLLREKARAVTRIEPTPFEYREWEAPPAAETQAQAEDEQQEPEDAVETSAGTFRVIKENGLTWWVDARGRKYERME